MLCPSYALVKSIYASVMMDMSQRIYQHWLPWWAFFIFGVSAWLLPNALYALVPYFITRTPEQNQISLWISVALQASNLVPLAYTVYTVYRYVDTHEQDNNCTSSSITIKSIEAPENVEASAVTTSTTSSSSTAPSSTSSPLVTSLAIFCVLSAITLTLTWDQTTMINGHSRSTALLITTFFCGIMSTSTAVIYWPWLANYQSSATVAVSTGENFSALLVALLSTIQQPGAPHPSFDARTFLWIVSACCMLSLVAYMLIQLTIGKYVRRDVDNVKNPYYSTVIADDKDTTILLSSALSTANIHAISLDDAQNTSPLAMPNPSYTEQNEHDLLQSKRGMRVTAKLVMRVNSGLCLLQAFRAFLAFGLLASLLPFSTRGYHDGSELLQWAIIVANIVALFASYSTKYVSYYSVPVLVTLLILPAAYILYLGIAVHPFSIHSVSFGWTLLILAYSCFSAITAYVSTTIFVRAQDPITYWPAFSLLSSKQQLDFISLSSQLIGLSVQLGAGLGVLLAYLLVNFSSLYG